MTGSPISHYEVLEKLGEGGMGVVYRARDTRLDRIVALKFLPSPMPANPEGKARFLREARAASALNHPNIIHIYDIDQQNGEDFIAMEFVPGKSLDQLIGRKGLPVKDALKYAIQIADAVAAAHAAGIVHRDLKPSNVIIADSGQVKVVDFGLAKLCSAVTTAGGETRTVGSLTEVGQIVGTVAYMSPEQAEGKSVDQRSDIFSFGTLLLEMVTGRRAFERETRTATLAAILHDDAAAPEGTPRELARLIARCLRKDPERRVQHMIDVRLALEEVKADYDSGAVFNEPAAGPGRRRRRLAALGLVLPAAALLTAGVLWLMLGRRSEPLPELRPVPLTSYPGDEVQPSFSPDGNQVAFVWNGERQDNPDIYVKLIGGAEKPLRLTTAPAVDLSPAWSPDGRSIAFVREPLETGRTDAVLLVPALGGPESLVCELGGRFIPPSGNPSSYRRAAPCPLIAWAPDGKTLVVADSPSGAEPLGLFAVALETGEKRRLTKAPGGIGDGAPAFSPDGQWLIFARAAGVTSSDLYRVRLAGGLRPAGAPERLTASKSWDAAAAWLPGGRDIVFTRGSWYVGPFNLWRLSVAGGAPSPVAAGVGADSGWPAVSPQGRLVFSRAVSDMNIWRVPLRAHAAAAPPQKFIYSTREEAAPQYSFDGARIVFTTNRSGAVEVWVCDSDGSNARELTRMGAPITGTPHWSPDGTQIVFDSNIEGQFDIYLVNAAGGTPRRLTTDPSDDALASFSPDGRDIYFSSNRTGRNEIWKMPATGGQAVQITRAGGRAPVMSRDGTLIYYERYSQGASQLCSVPPGGGTETKLLDSVDFLEWAVSTDGIYFVARSDTDPRHTIQFFDFKTRSIKPVLVPASRLDVWLAVSPDGRSLLYTQIDESGSDLMLVENFR